MSDVPDQLLSIHLSNSRWHMTSPKLWVWWGVVRGHSSTEGHWNYVLYSLTRDRWLVQLVVPSAVRRWHGQEVRMDWHIFRVRSIDRLWGRIYPFYRKHPVKLLFLFGLKWLAESASLAMWALRSHAQRFAPLSRRNAGWKTMTLQATQLEFLQTFVLCQVFDTLVIPEPN